MAILAVKQQNPRATVLPLHIDTASFTNPPQTYPWRRIANKRQLPALILLVLLIFSISTNLVQHGRQSRTISTFKPNDILPQVRLYDHHHAIIVAGHAIYKGDPTTSSLSDNDHWILEPFQQNGQVSTFIKHIEKGVELASDDPKSVLIFSGGQTRAEAGPRSEGQSYWMIAESMNNRTELLSRTVVEDYARDSYENILFSLCRFYEMTGRYPSQLTVVGFEFKRKRFQELHLPALRFPLDRFEYIGIDPPFDLEAASERIAGEAAHSQGPFSKDLYGCHAPLIQKRLDRNPFRRKHPYNLTCPELSHLINYCPNNNAIFPGQLPW